MKKIILLHLFVLCTVSCIYSQSVVYVIFTSTQSDDKGVGNLVFDMQEWDRDASHLFSIFERAKDTRKQLYFYDFIYKNRKDDIDNPFQIKPKDFLKTINLVDWDLIEG